MRVSCTVVYIAEWIDLRVQLAIMCSCRSLAVMLQRLPIGNESVELIGLIGCRYSLVDTDSVCGVLWSQLLFVTIRWCCKWFVCSRAAA